MGLNDLRLSKVFDPKDEIDESILNHSVRMIMGLQLSTLLSSKEDHDIYFGYIKNVAQSLFKSNAHRRNYLQLESVEIKSLFDQETENSSQDVDIAINPIELNAEIDGFLSHIKGALDSLAKSFEVIFGFKLGGGWHKDRGLSGKRILNALDNMAGDKREKANDLRRIIEGNVSWISYLVYLRDRPHHHGGIKSITDLVFDHKQKDVIPQQIYHPDGSSELVKDFLTRIIKEFDIFVENIVVSSLSSAALPGMALVRNEKGFPPYSWARANVSKGSSAVDGSTKN